MIGLLQRLVPRHGCGSWASRAGSVMGAPAGGWVNVLGQAPVFHLPTYVAVLYINKRKTSFGLRDAQQTMHSYPTFNNFTSNTRSASGGMSAPAPFVP